jgi:tetratricopeptide (TPR) repeat protein
MNRGLTLILLFNLCSLTSQAQTDENEEFYDLFEKVRFFEDNDNDSSLYYLNELLVKAPSYAIDRRVDIYFLAGEVYDNLLLLDLSLGYYTKVLEYDVLQIGQQTRLYGELIELYTSLHDYDRIDSLIVETDRLIARGNVSESVLADVYFDYGTYYWYSGQYEEAINYLRSSIELIKKGGLLIMDTWLMSPAS